MFRKILLTFLVSLVLFFLICQGLFKAIRLRQEQRETRQTSIILENVRDRFKHFLDTPLSIALVGAEYLDHQKLDTDYGVLYDKILKLNDDILGVNLVNADGKIIRVLPLEPNSRSLGKVTQYIDQLNDSKSKSENFWLSPPMTLYQGQQGFIIYVPIQDGTIHKGWLASVISTEKFAKKFSLDKFLKDYHLNIKDESSGGFYFSTGLTPANQSFIQATDFHIDGRTLVFEIWRKNGRLSNPESWGPSLLIALILAIGLAYIIRLREVRQRAKAQLLDIRSLLNLTAKEALNTLVEEQSKLSNASVAHVTYLTHLVEQIELIQMMAKSPKAQSSSRFELLPLLKSQLSDLETIVEKKELQVKYREDDLGKVMLTANQNLFQNSVLGVILSHLIVHASSRSEIEVRSEETDEKVFIFFHARTLHQDDQGSLLIDRRMEVAKKVLEIFEGELYMQKDLKEGMIIRIVLPRQ